MSQSDTIDVDGAEFDEQATIVVDDPEDYARTQQLRAIFDSRRQYRDVRSDASDAQKAGEISKAHRDRLVFDALQELIFEIEPLLKEHDEGTNLWYNREYQCKQPATIPQKTVSFKQAVSMLSIEQITSLLPSHSYTVIYPDESDEQEEPTIEFGGGGPGVTGLNESNKQTLQHAATDLGTAKLIGLKDVADGVVWAFKNRGREAFRRGRPSVAVSDAVYRDCAQFIQDIGLGVDLEEQTNQTKITDDMIEEVEQWRQNNI